MAFKRFSPGERREVPDGLWIKCTDCGAILYRKHLEKNYSVCPNCNWHFKIPAKEYLRILTDEFKELFGNIEPVDPLKFREYEAKLKRDQSKTGLREAIITGEAKIDRFRTAFGCMDFNFLGGSMGSVVGEKVTRIIYYAIQERLPLIIVCASGGARMYEGILSLMQMAKTSAALTQFSDARLPYISILTNPTTAGVMASFASLGDIVIAEPRATLGFAGARVIRETIKQELPKGFQTAEFMLEHGLIEKVVPRRDLKPTLIKFLEFFCE